MFLNFCVSKYFYMLFYYSIPFDTTWQIYTILSSDITLLRFLCDFFSYFLYFVVTFWHSKNIILLYKFSQCITFYLRRLWKFFTQFLCDFKSFSRSEAILFTLVIIKNLFIFILIKRFLVIQLLWFYFFSLNFLFSVFVFFYKRIFCKNVLRLKKINLKRLKDN